MGDKKPRVLFIHPDTLGFSPDVRKNPLHYLSRYMRGEYIAVLRIGSARAARDHARAVHDQVPDFRLFWTRSYRLPGGLRQLWDIAFFVGTALRLTVSEGRYNAVIAYGPFRTGLAGYLIQLFTGTPLILEIPGNPQKSLRLAGGRAARAKQWLGARVTRFLARRARLVWLLYPGQLNGLIELPETRVAVVPTFVPIGALGGVKRLENTVLFLGYPWYLKGVDVLLRAFNRLSERYPATVLRVVGHCPDRTMFEAIAAGNPKIEFSKAVPHDEAMDLLRSCRVFVLPSRTEAMGRALIEAMAMGKPVIASAVDGIPHYVRNGDTGLLFVSEDDRDLAAKLDLVLSDDELGRRMGERAAAYVAAEMSEDAHARRVRDIVLRVRRHWDPQVDAVAL